MFPSWSNWSSLFQFYSYWRGHLLLLFWWSWFLKSRERTCKQRTADARKMNHRLSPDSRRRSSARKRTNTNTSSPRLSPCWAGGVSSAWFESQNFFTTHKNIPSMLQTVCATLVNVFIWRKHSPEHQIYRKLVDLSLSPSHVWALLHNKLLHLREFEQLWSRFPSWRSKIWRLNSVNRWFLFLDGRKKADVRWN